MDEIEADPIDDCAKLRQSVEARFGILPVEMFRPIVAETPKEAEFSALSPALSLHLVRPAGSPQT
uniref:Uncharacterized protein n=1 Tax=Ralstonia solanacearum TaxID=305 RepID=A0A0S4U0T5_RALSL|nr:protein of unknown function [Ralstonia solanacearum]